MGFSTETGPSLKALLFVARRNKNKGPVIGPFKLSTLVDFPIPASPTKYWNGNPIVDVPSPLCLEQQFASIDQAIDLSCERAEPHNSH